MEYREIVSVTGIGGLFQLISTKSDGAIVRNLADNSTKFISARLHNVTPLDSIEIYTTGTNVRLQEVLEKMKDSSEALPDAKKADNNTIKDYFKKVFAEIDEDRVYVSDMKKILKWYVILKDKDLLKIEREEETKEETADKEKNKEEKPVKKTTAKKASKEKEDTEKEKPAKKTAAKKTAKKKATGEKTTDEKKPAKKTAAKKTAKKKAEYICMLLKYFEQICFCSL